jgi:ATP phosphoribosyltransferase regulatory subunit
LLSGTGKALDLQTFKLVDQLSGRTMGLRADTTPQVARIDAHLLNRRGVARLCYCGPVLHTRPSSLHATREPLQFGAEIYGHAGLEADLEILTLALDLFATVNTGPVTVDLANARLVGALFQAGAVAADLQAHIQAALAAKDGAELRTLTRNLPPEVAKALALLPQLYGDASVLDEALAVLPKLPAVSQSIESLRWLAGHLDAARVGFDLSDSRGYAYYTGVRFSIFSSRSNDALARGGRYDAVGSVFGRTRPAVGFSLDVKMLAAAMAPSPLHPAIRAPWGEAADLRAAIAGLRLRGETVVCVLPGHENEVDEFHCDRELVQRAGVWVVQAV